MLITSADMCDLTQPRGLRALACEFFDLLVTQPRGARALGRQWRLTVYDNFDRGNLFSPLSNSFEENAWYRSHVSEKMICVRACPIH